jgi:cell division protease FtsH
MNSDQGHPVPAKPVEPTPPPRYESRPRDEERATRKPLALWDRIKILLLLLGGWSVLLWSTVARFDPQITFRDALNQTLRSGAWLLVLAALELARQLHYLISENSPRYYKWWTHSVFGSVEKRAERMNDWNRFRVGRAIKWLFWLIILDLALAKIYHEPAATAIFQLPAKVVAALPFIFQLAFAFVFVMLQFVGLFWFLSKGGVDVYFPDDVKTRFTDVKGQDGVLEKVKENMVFIEDPESIEKRGGYVPGGILLWGPPGTGKTLMAQAVAGETAKPYVFVDPGAFINMFMGVGILKVKSLYRKLRKMALRYGGVIVFFDEADSLGNRGAIGGGPWNTFGGLWSTSPSCNGLAYLPTQTVSVLMHSSLDTSIPSEAIGSKQGIIAGLGGMGGGGMGTLQSLLSEMDGLKKPRGFWNRVVRRALGMRPKPPPKYRILHIFATNRPDVLDEAMLRPGRIDRIYKVGYPSKDGRMATYEYYLAKVKHELTEEQVEKLATITPYATGASIKDMVNEALVIAIRDGRDTISWRDVIKAKQLKEHGLPDDAEYIERERHAVAVHEACHAVVAYRTRRHMIIDMATIERRGDIGGFVSSIPPEDQFIHWRSERESDIMTSLSSLAGERMFFDEDNSAGVGSDLRAATALASLMEGYWGMGSTVGSHGVSKFSLAGARGGYTGEDGQDRMLMETELGAKVEGNLQEFLGRTRQLLAENRQHVLAVAHALETERSISGDDIIAIIEGQKGPLIDGRPYADSESRARIEAYHLEALAAHKGHAKVSVPLPLLTTAFEVPPRPDSDGERQPAAAVESPNGERSGEEGEQPDGERRSGQGVTSGQDDEPGPSQDQPV